MDLITPSTGANREEGALHGIRLRFFQVLWGFLVLCDLIVLTAGLPVFYRLLNTVCLTPGPSCPNGLLDQLTPQAASALQHVGLSLHVYALYVFTWDLLTTLVFLLVGTVIIWRRAHTSMGLFVSFLLINFGSLGLNFAHFNALNVVASDNVLFLLLSRLGGPLSILAYLCLGFFFFIFPDGRFVPRWSWALMSLWLLNFVFWLAPVNSPLQINFWPPLLLYLWLMILFGGSVATQVYRYRRVASRVQRQQIKWLIYGVALVLVFSICFGLVVALFPVPGASRLSVLAEPLWRFYFLPVPFCIGIAILRYRLWDIDLIINRMLVYGALTLSVIGVYVLVVVGLGTFIQVQGNVLLSLLATGLIAVLFQPLRLRLQRGVNRLLYGERDDPYKVISRLGQRLEAALAPQAVLPTIVETVTQALKLPYAAISLKQDGEDVIAASSGRAADEPTRLPLVYQGEHIGDLLLSPRARGETFSSADRALLNDLARQAGIAVHAVRLTTDLQRLTQELQHSRTQLVTAREEERRRLRRDLHDGLGSVLASLNWRSGALRTLLARDPVAADALVVEQQHTIQMAIADIRRLVYDLRPPTLDELGLVGAIREQAAKQSAEAVRNSPQGLQVEVCTPDHLPALPAAVEVAAYRIVQEALANVTRHAHAQSCRISFACEQEMLYVEITDDGVGLPENYRAGVGLLSLRERAEELGGTCEISPAGGGGTRVRACLPLPKE
jgi:signal transduction histidine kinase